MRGLILIKPQPSDYSGQIEIDLLTTFSGSGWEGEACGHNNANNKSLEASVPLSDCNWYPPMPIIRLLMQLNQSPNYLERGTIKD